MDNYTYSGNDFDPEQSFRADNRQPEREEKPERQRRRAVREPEEEPSHRTRTEKPRAGVDREPAPLRLVKFLKRKTTRIVIGSALILFAGVLLMSFFSYFATGAADQSRVVTESVGSLAQNPDQIHNVAGPVGAKLSHAFLAKGLGVGSFVFIVYLVVLALGLFGYRKVHFWQLTFKSLILAITLSFIFGLFSLGSESHILLGGYHGRYLNIYIISRLGWVGAVAVSLLLAVIVGALFFSDFVAYYNNFQTAKRTRRDKQLLAKDKEAFTAERIEEALADGPMTAQTAAAAVDKKDDDDETQTFANHERPANILDIHSMIFDRPAENPAESPGRSEDLFPPTEREEDKADDSDPFASMNTPEEPRDTPEPEITSNNPPAVSVVAPETGFVIRETEIEQARDNEADPVEAQGLFDPKAELSRFRMPSLDLLIDRPRKNNSVDLTEQEENKERIIKTLNDYGIQIQQITATVGPTITLYEIIPAEGVRIAKIKRLEDDIALSLAALGIRIIAPIPGRGTIGIEVPNKEPQIVSIRSILGSKAFKETKYQLPIALGAKIDNEVYVADLAKMPHLLVAGATGQGKSVGLNTIIASLLYKLHPTQLKFVLVDPKLVEFSLYNKLEKHYLAKLPEVEDPVVSDSMQVINTLKSLCQEMEDRYGLLKDADVRSISEYNTKFINRRLNPEKGHRFLPYIVIIIDEFADLIMTSGKEVETPIARIAQKARAVGMHMIIATQRPSTNVITGIIKANFPGRIAFRVSQMVDSRTILDAPGANQLIGRGDMLISNNGTTERVQCALIETEEVENICKHINDQIGFTQAYPLPDFVQNDAEATGSFPGAGSPSDRDPLFEEVARWIVNDTTASTSGLQRRYSIGFNRAGKIMDQLAEAGIVGPAQGGKPRQVLVDAMSIDLYLQK